MSDVIIDPIIFDCYKDLQLRRRYQFVVFDIRASKLICIKKCPGTKHPASESPTAKTPAQRHTSLVEFIRENKMNEGCIIITDLPNKKKILYALWTPEGAPPKEKVTFSAASNAIMAAFGGIHKNIHCSSIEELSLEAMEKCF